MIRIATADDSTGIRDVYAPYVTDTCITFEYEIPSDAEVKRRIVTGLECFPWLVYERDGRVAGYAYAGPHRVRDAYQWSAEVSVYLDATVHRRGVGRGLYSTLFALLTRQGVCRLFAGITLPNEASVGLHESVGFAAIGIYHAVGYKHRRWHDVGWWEMSLQSAAPDPSALVPFSELRVDSVAMEEAVGVGQRLIRS